MKATEQICSRDKASCIHTAAKYGQKFLFVESELNILKWIERILLN